MLNLLSVLKNKFLSFRGYETLVVSSLEKVAI